MSNQFSSSVLECIATAILVLDKKLSVLYMNMAAETLFGITLRQVEGKHFNKMVFLEVQDETALNESVKSFRGFSVRESTLRLVHRGTIHADYTVTPNQQDDANVFLAVEVNQVDRRLKIIKEEALLSQQKTTRMLVRSLAHEVKNPLGGLRGAAQLLEYELESGELKEYTNIIIREADRLKNLMNQMLGPNSRPQFKTVNIHQITEQVRKLLRIDIPDGVSLRFDYDPSIPDLYADADRLIQAILNITSNALQAVEQGGGVVIKTRTLRNFTIGQTFHKLLVCLQVIDDGAGVPSELQEKIFFPMVTTKTEGTGLGLSIAQSLVNEHGGLIEYERNQAQSIFSIMLPIKSRDKQ